MRFFRHASVALALVAAACSSPTESSGFPGCHLWFTEDIPSGGGTSLHLVTKGTRIVGDGEVYGLNGVVLKHFTVAGTVSENTIALSVFTFPNAPGGTFVGQFVGPNEMQLTGSLDGGSPERLTLHLACS